MREKQEYLLLKWGTVKGWGNISQETADCLNEFYKDGKTLSVMMDRPGDERREVLCNVIDSISDDGCIRNDWTGEQMTKEEAKKYVREY